MNNLSLKIHRIDLALKQPLVLGPGLEIHTIPYYAAKLTDGQTDGIGWGVSSPLWGGLAHLPLEEGILLVEKQLQQISSRLLTKHRQSENLEAEARKIHEEFFDSELLDDDGDKILPLIKGMVLAPVEGALCEFLAKKNGLPMMEFLQKYIASDSGVFTHEPLEYICPFLTIGGTATAETVGEQRKIFGERPIVKFKIGSKKDPVAEAEFMASIMLHAAPENTFMVIDNNQAYTPEECRTVVMKLKELGVVEKLLFFEQPCKRGEEPMELDRLFFDIAPNLGISLDESVGSAADIERLSGKFSKLSPENILVIPKFEKGGIIEVVKILEAAKSHDLKVSPSTLTGPPPQIPQYWEIFRHAKNIFTLPGKPDSFGAEANAYEILDWPAAVETLMAESERSKSTFSIREPFLKASKPDSTPWPEECNTRPFEEIPWKASFDVR